MILSYCVAGHQGWHPFHPPIIGTSQGVQRDRSLVGLLRCGRAMLRHQLRPRLLSVETLDGNGAVSWSWSRFHLLFGIKGLKMCIWQAEFFNLEGVRPTKIIQNTNISRLDIAWLRVITPSTSRSRQPAPVFSCAEVTPTAGAASQHSLWAGGQSVVDD